MANDYHDRSNGGMLAILVVIMLLLAAVGGGAYFVTARRSAVLQAEEQALVAAGVAREATAAARRVRPTSPDVPQMFAGKVIQLAAPEHGVALVTDDGNTYPLIEDDASRMLFVDARLRDRPVRLSAVLVPDTRNLRVVYVQTVKDGVVYDVDYWCETCHISIVEPGPCACCGDPVVLRERPAGPGR